MLFRSLYKPQTPNPSECDPKQSLMKVVAKVCRVGNLCTPLDSTYGKVFDAEQAEASVEGRHRVEKKIRSLCVVCFLSRTFYFFSSESGRRERYEALKKESDEGFTGRYSAELEKLEQKHKLQVMEAEQSREKIIDRLERELAVWRIKSEQPPDVSTLQTANKLAEEEKAQHSAMKHTLRSVFAESNMNLLSGVPGAKPTSLLDLQQGEQYVLAYENREGCECGEFSLSSLTDPESEDFTMINDDMPGKVIDMVKISPMSTEYLVAVTTKKAIDEATLIYTMSVKDGMLKNLGFEVNPHYMIQKRKGKREHTSSAGGRVFGVKSPWVYYIGYPSTSVKRVGYQECMWKCGDVAGTTGQGTIQQIQIVGNDLYWLSTCKFGKVSLSSSTAAVVPVSFEKKAQGGVATTFEVAEGLVAVSVSYDQTEKGADVETCLGIYSQQGDALPAWCWEDVSVTDHVKWIRIAKVKHDMKLLLLFYNSDTPTVRPVIFNGTKMLVDEPIVHNGGSRLVGLVNLPSSPGMASWMAVHAKHYLHVHVKLE